MTVRRSCSRFTLASRLCGLVLLGCTVGTAVAEELPQSPACRTALQALDGAEMTLAAAAASSPNSADVERQRTVAARLQPLRVRVAKACLGGLTASPSPSQHTLLVPAPARPAAAMPRLPTATVPPVVVPMPRLEALVTVGSCNAAVCIASDGSTLTRVGPNLVGPRGLCSVQGGFLRCP